MVGQSFEHIYLINLQKLTHDLQLSSAHINSWSNSSVKPFHQCNINHSFCHYASDCLATVTSKVPFSQQGTNLTNLQSSNTQNFSIIGLSVPCIFSSFTSNFSKWAPIKVKLDPLDSLLHGQDLWTICCSKLHHHAYWTLGRAFTYSKSHSWRS